MVDFYVLTQASEMPSGRQQQPWKITFAHANDEYSHSPEYSFTHTPKNLSLYSKTT